MQDTKKVAGELLVELEKKGVTFETVDGKLKYKDSKGNFTENSKEKVKKYKEEIIEILKKKQTIDEFITDNDYETNVYPLTDVQAAYLVGKTEAVKWGGIGCKGYIEVDFGSYSAEELSRAWKVLVNRHEMLRAKVTEVGFEILERDEIDYEIKIVNLQKMAEREKVDTLSKIREDFSEYVFHTEEPPLFKVLITKRIEGNFFHLLVDLIVSDFASVQLLISEMGELLKGASLEKIRYKFSDYAMFNQQRKGSLKWHQDRMYWLERLKKLPEAPILPQDGRAADKCENTYEFYRFQKHINQSDWKRIKEIAGEYGVTVSSVLIGISRIQQRFVKYAKKNSNKTAVIDAVETVTYGELLERAEYIAGYLRKEFVENRTGLVAIRMKKSVNQIAAVMGVLIAGFSYLPIDIKQPLARQEKILSKANVIVELDEKKVNMILQNLEYRLEKHPEFQNPIAYVIFTSGSTGEPKGVVMSHTAAQNTLIAIENMYNISEEDTILGIAELSFDLSVFDIFSVLGVGGTLVLPNPEKGPDASHWGRLLNEYKVTLWNSVPAQAEMLDAFASKSESYPTVRLVLLSGDWINTSLPGRLRKIMTNAQMISLGGATEGGIWSIYHEIDEIEERPTILYGKALLGQWMGVVDEELRICPEYVSGQIAIGGYSLAEGYLGDTTLTKEKFVYVEEEKNRIYLTGDNGRYVENGDIEFLGRLDNQVKINGHRIEIAEIENAIRGMQNIEDCCVVYNQSIGKGVLIAFIKNKISSISYTKEEYRKQLAFFLPPAMIPSEFVNVERFPLSTNGKIDRKGLAESIQKNIKVKHNAKATLISQKKEYVELAKSIKKIVCSISGNDYIDYEDNLLENGLDSLLLSQISGRIVSDIQEAQGMRFDEILRASLTMPTIMGIAQYISDCKNPSKNQMHSNAGNQTRNSYTVVYIFGDNENEIRDVLIEKLSASNISCKRVGGQEIIERCHEDISVKKKYIIAFSEMASLCITKASELLGENIIINRIFLINPSKAKESDLYLGDISIIDGNSVAIKSWEKAVLGNVREFESNSNDIFDIIMRELENDK